MLSSTVASRALAPGDPPLTFPREVWEAMPADYRAACESAQAVLEAFGAERTLGLRDVRKRASLGLDDTLRGLEVLDGMELVEVDASDRGPRITLRALPEGHVRITGPDGKVRWVFIARPLDAPDVAKSDLN
jgi:hypothetical protein